MGILPSIIKIRIGAKIFTSLQPKVAVLGLKGALD